MHHALHELDTPANVHLAEIYLAWYHQSPL